MAEENAFFDGFMKRFLKNDKNKKNAAKLRADEEEEEEASNGENGDESESNGNSIDDFRPNNPQMPSNYVAQNEFLIPVGGKKVNVCDQKFLNLATIAHDRIRDIWIAVCSGHSGATWLLSKFVKSKMNEA